MCVSVLCHIIQKKSVLLRALCHIACKKSAVLKHTLLTITSPSFAVHLRSPSRIVFIAANTLVDVMPFVASRFLSAVCCMTLRDICRHSSSAFVGRVI